MLKEASTLHLALVHVCVERLIAWHASLAQMVGERLAPAMELRVACMHCRSERPNVGARRLVPGWHFSQNEHTKEKAWSTHIGFWLRWVRPYPLISSARSVVA